MSKFSETKKRIQEEQKSNKKTFNEAYFNEIGTALLNDPDYEKDAYVTKKGELVKTTTKPIEKLRKQIIGKVAKEAGADAAETEKLVSELEFPKLDLYGFVDATIFEYLSLGKRLPLVRQENFVGSIEFVDQPARIVDAKKPGETVGKQQRQGAYIKLKAKSNCPDNLREDLE